MKEMTAARRLLRQAQKQARKNAWASRSPRRKAIEILERIAPNSEELAEAYTGMCFLHFGVKSKKNRDEHRRQAVAWYEKAITVWERNGNRAALSGNLTNLGSLYRRYGDLETALARCLRGLELERTRGVFDDESVHAWTHVASVYVALNRLEQAETVVQEGLRIFGDTNPQTAYLWATLADSYRARAQWAQKRAEELVPPDSCPI